MRQTRNSTRCREPLMNESDMCHREVYAGLCKSTSMANNQSITSNEGHHEMLPAGPRFWV